MQSKPSQQKCRRIGLFGQKVDLVDHYGKKLEDIEQNVRLEQSDVSLAEVCDALFTLILLIIFLFSFYFLGSLSLHLV